MSDSNFELNLQRVMNLSKEANEANARVQTTPTGLPRPEGRADSIRLYLLHERKRDSWSAAIWYAHMFNEQIYSVRVGNRRVDAGTQGSWLFHDFVWRLLFWTSCVDACNRLKMSVKINKNKWISKDPWIFKNHESLSIHESSRIRESVSIHEFPKINGSPRIHEFPRIHDSPRIHESLEIHGSVRFINPLKLIYLQGFMSLYRGIISKILNLSNSS